MATMVVLLLWSKLLFQIFPVTSASNHWVVTEDGRIQAQMDSIFSMRRPYDLVAFMKQEERAELLEDLRKELIAKKEEIDKNEDRDTGLEDRFYRTDPDCQAGGKPLPEFDLYISTVLPLENKGIRPEEHIDFKAPPYPKPQPPFCTKVVNLDFSMHAFEHLEGMKARVNLTGSPELGLKNAITHRDNVDDYGHLIYEAFKKNTTSWVLYNMAAFYWRIKGDPYHVVECLRRAMHYSPYKQKDVALISLANILHRARYSNEAAIVVHAALDVSNELNVNHFTLGNIYAVLGEYNRSVICFENTLKIQPEFEAAAKRKHAVKCHAKLEKALETQHRSLQKTLKDLKDYQRKHEYWQQQQEKMNREQAAHDVKVIQRISYENFKLRERSGDMAKYCQMVEKEGRQVLTCTWGRQAQEEAINHEWFNRRQNWQRQEEAVQHHEPMMSSPMSDYNYTEPVRPPRFQKRNALTQDTDMPYRNPDWPSQEECEQHVQKFPAWNDYPTTFLPAENKGFEVKALLSKALGLQSNQEHPLPWYPPVCVTLADIKDSRRSYDHIQAVKDRSKVPPRLPDTSMRKVLLDYVERAEVTEEEVGQRILSAVKKNIGPKWILFNLAGLYWRIIGNNVHSIECIRRSLAFVPDKYKDVPLVNLANVFYRWGRVDDAVTVTRDALVANAYEPETHFFLANLLFAKGNLTGAVWHYEEALRQQSDNDQAFNMLRIIKCYSKFHRTAQSSAPKTPTPTCTQAPSSGNCPNTKQTKGEGTEGQSRVICKVDSGKEKCVVETRTRQKAGQPCEEEPCSTHTCSITPVKTDSCPDLTSTLSQMGPTCGGNSCESLFKDGDNPLGGPADKGKQFCSNTPCGDGVDSKISAAATDPNAYNPMTDPDFNKHLDEISTYYQQKGACNGEDCNRLLVQCHTKVPTSYGFVQVHTHHHLVYRQPSYSFPTQCMNMEKRPHIRLEVMGGILHQRLLFSDDPTKLNISPEECVLFNDGSKSSGCAREEFKPYIWEGLH